MAGPNERELRLKLTVVSDPSGGSKAMAELAREAKKVEQAAGKAAQSLSQMFGGGGAGSGSAWSGVAAAANRAMPTMHSQVGAFQRPIPVIIMGPKPLLVEGVAGGKGGPGGGGQPREKEEKKEDPLAKTLSILRNLGLGGVAGNIGHFQGYGEALNEMGYKRGGAFLSRNAAILGAGQSAIDFGGQVASVLHGRYTTAEQKARSIIKEIPIAGWVQQKIDQFGGRAAAMEQIQTRAEQNRIQRHVGIEQAAFRAQWNPEYAGTVERANLLGRARPVLEGAINRETAVGQREFAERQRVLPVIREGVKLEREAAVATKQRSAAEKELNERQARARQLQEQLVGLRREEAKGGSGEARQRLMTRLTNTGEELQATLEQVRSGTMNVHGLKLREAAARRAAGMSGVQLAREQAGILEERAGTAAAGAQRLGGMNAVSRRWGVAAVRMLTEGGISPDMLPPELLAQAQSLAPQTVGKLMEQRGAKTDEFKELERLAPADFAGNPEELRRQAQQQRDQAEQRELQLEQTQAAAGKKIGAGIGEIVRGVIDKMGDEIIRAVEEKLKTAKGWQ